MERDITYYLARGGRTKNFGCRKESQGKLFIPLPLYCNASVSFMPTAQILYLLYFVKVFAQYFMIHRIHLVSCTAIKVLSRVYLRFPLFANT